MCTHTHTYTVYLQSSFLCAKAVAKRKEQKFWDLDHGSVTQYLCDFKYRIKSVFLSTSVLLQDKAYFHPWALHESCETGLQGLLSWVVLLSAFWLALANGKHQKEERKLKAFLHLPYLTYSWVRA